MKSIFIFLSIFIIGCKPFKTNLTYQLSGTQLNLQNIESKQIKRIELSTDPIFDIESILFEFNKTYSEHFQKESIPKIFILNKEIDLETIKRKVNEEFNVLNSSRTVSEMTGISDSENFIIRNHSTEYSLTFNTKKVKGKLFTTYFYVISSENIKFRNAYYDIINEMK